MPVRKGSSRPITAGEERQRPAEMGRSAASVSSLVPDLCECRGRSDATLVKNVDLRLALPSLLTKLVFMVWLFVSIDFFYG